MKGVSIISFDCYGTLVDWESRVNSLVGEQNHKFNKLLYNTAFENFRPWELVLKKVISECGLTGKINPEDFLQCEAFSDILYLNELRGKFKLALLTNSSMLFLESTLGEYLENFDLIFTSDITKSYKPHPRHFGYLIDTVGIPSQILHMSAYPNYDLHTAKSLGINTCLIKRHPSKCDFKGIVLNNLFELNNVISLS